MADRTTLAGVSWDEFRDASLCIGGLAGYIEVLQRVKDSDEFLNWMDRLDKFEHSQAIAKSMMVVASCDSLLNLANPDIVTLGSIAHSNAHKFTIEFFFLVCNEVQTACAITGRPPEWDEYRHIIKQHWLDVATRMELLPRFPSALIQARIDRERSYIAAQFRATDEKVKGAPWSVPMTIQQIGQLFTVHRNQVKATVFSKYETQQVGAKHRMRESDLPENYLELLGLNKKTD